MKLDNHDDTKKLTLDLRRGSFYGFYSLGQLLGPVLGPVLGGIISETLGWR